MLNQTVLLLITAALSAAAGQMLFKIGATGKEQFSEFINFPIALGLVLYAGSTCLWIYVLAREQLVNVYAFTALSFVLVYVGSVAILGEQLHVKAFAGVVLVLAGLFLITSDNA